MAAQRASQRCSRRRRMDQMIAGEVAGFWLLVRGGRVAAESSISLLRVGRGGAGLRSSGRILEAVARMSCRLLLTFAGVYLGLRRRGRCFGRRIPNLLLKRPLNANCR